MSNDWKCTQKLAGSFGSQTMAMLAFSKAEDIYIFENRKTGERVRVHARTMDEAGENLADGNYSEDD